MSLHFDAAQIAALAVFSAIGLFFILVFAVVALASRFEVAFERVRSVGYAVRRPWFLFLVSSMVVVLSVLAFWLPYAGGGTPVTDVRVVGGQFYWSLSPSEFEVGERVRFQVTGADVNHGFGLYDPDGKLLGSVQAMPGYRNKLTITLEKAGTYTIACLEYCGLRHHEMIREFTVKP